MTGAIEFMQAWRDYCKGKKCGECKREIYHVCMDVCINWTDEEINKIVKTVMAEKRRHDDD